MRRPAGTVLGGSASVAARTVLGGSASVAARYAALAVAAVTTVGVGAAATGVDRSTLDPVPDVAPTAPESGGGPGTFTGTFDATAPTLYPLDLAVGDAVRMWVRATSDDLLIDDDEFRGGLSLGVAVSPKLADELLIPTWNSEGGFENDNFFSDYRDLYSDYDWQGPGGISPYEPIARQYDVVWVDDDGGIGSIDPPQFGCAARLEPDEGPALSAWVVFVAPAASTYTVMVAGLGDYELQIEVQAPPPGSAGFAPDPFPIRGEPWIALVEAHREFMFDPAFYPADTFDAGEGSPAQLETECLGP